MARRARAGKTQDERDAARDARRLNIERLIDETVAQSFPASDPPAAMAGQDQDADQEPAHRHAAVAEAAAKASAAVTLDGESFDLEDGAVVIAAITSCTNTSNPSVMLGAGLLARNAVARGLERKPWVKTSLAPGSKVVVDYYERAGLTPYLDQLGFNLVGFGCTTTPDGFASFSGPGPRSTQPPGNSGSLQEPRFSSPPSLGAVPAGMSVSTSMHPTFILGAATSRVPNGRVAAMSEST